MSYVNPAVNFSQVFCNLIFICFGKNILKFVNFSLYLLKILDTNFKSTLLSIMIGFLNKLFMLDKEFKVLKEILAITCDYL